MQAFKCHCVALNSHFFVCVSDLGMDDEGDDDPVPLPNVNAAILKKVHHMLFELK